MYITRGAKITHKRNQYFSFGSTDPNSSTPLAAVNQLPAKSLPELQTSLRQNPRHRGTCLCIFDHIC